MSTPDNGPVNGTDDPGVDLKDTLKRIPEEWGRDIHCDKGWHAIIAETDRKMAALCPDYLVYQVKEKFGTLRFYWGLPDNYWDFPGDDDSESNGYAIRVTVQEIMFDVEAQAEYRSSRTCEVCGAAGNIRNRLYWLKTLCDGCAVNLGYEGTDLDGKP